MKHITPKKSLGQNFLTDKTVSQKIVDSLKISDNEIIIEIGPGMGALTGIILNQISEKSNTKLIAIELDQRAVNQLESKFSDAIIKGVFTIVNEDITKVDLLKLIQNQKNSVVETQQTQVKVKVVGNLPYYITGLILNLVLANSEKLSSFVFMVQKEVADRILAKNGSKDYSLLSLACNLYGQSEKIVNVKPGAFFPPPKVSSTVVKISFENHKLKCEFAEIEKVMKMAKITFNQRRKMLGNTLRSEIEKKSHLKLSETIEHNEFYREILTKRPEQLTPEEFISLYRKIYT